MPQPSRVWSRTMMPGCGGRDVTRRRATGSPKTSTAIGGPGRGWWALPAGLWAGTVVVPMLGLEGVAGEPTRSVAEDSGGASRGTLVAATTIATPAAALAPTVSAAGT